MGDNTTRVYSMTNPSIEKFGESKSRLGGDCLLDHFIAGWLGSRYQRFMGKEK
jgi:hypothetical protein